MLILGKLQKKYIPKKLRTHISITHLDTTLLLHIPWNKISAIPTGELLLSLLATYLEGVYSNWRTKERWALPFSLSPSNYRYNYIDIT